MHIIQSDTADTFDIGDGAAHSVSSFVFQIEGAGGWDGEITVKGRVRGSSLSWQTLPVQNIRTLADVAAGTALTADGIYAVRADGLELQIVHAAITTGSVSVAVEPLVG